jgi:hypothetical protein
MTSKIRRANSSLGQFGFVCSPVPQAREMMLAALLAVQVAAFLAALAINLRIAPVGNLVRVGDNAERCKSQTSVTLHWRQQCVAKETLLGARSLVTRLSASRCFWCRW